MSAHSLRQGTPVPLREFLQQHEVLTAYERGWSTLKNGELLDAAERENFAVLVTTEVIADVGPLERGTGGREFAAARRDLESEPLSGRRAIR